MQNSLLPATSWCAKINWARNCVEHNVILTFDASQGHYCLKTLVPIAIGKALRMWPSAPLLAKWSLCLYLRLSCIQDLFTFTCDLCGLKFVHPNQLRVHLICCEQTHKSITPLLKPPFHTLRFFGPFISQPFLSAHILSTHSPTNSVKQLSNSRPSNSHLSSFSSSVLSQRSSNTPCSLVNVDSDQPEISSSSSGDESSCSESERSESQQSTSQQSDAHQTSGDSRTRSSSGFTSSGTMSGDTKLKIIKNEQIISDKFISSSSGNGLYAPRLLNSSSRHLKVTKEPRTHTCLFCGKLYTRKYGLKIHVRTHTGHKPLKCVHCSRAFSDPSNLNKHMRLHQQHRLWTRTLQMKKLA